MTSTLLVCGAGGFIGSHLVKRLKSQGHAVIGVDLKHPEYALTSADHFHILDLRNESSWKTLVSAYPNLSDVYQLAADMGGAGYIFTGENDANVMHNSASINLHCAKYMSGRARVFYSSSACIYPAENQTDPNNPNCEESSAYPANPDSEYGWEKLFSERMYLAARRNWDLSVRVARFHNIFGPEGTWRGGKEKAPAALCRKVAELPAEGGEIEVWGTGEQTRSFLYIDECLDGILRLTQSDCLDVVNIGSEERVSINQLVGMIAHIAKKEVRIKHIAGPMGVAGRNSDNALIRKRLDWAPSRPLVEGLATTYAWIQEQVKKQPSE